MEGQAHPSNYGKLVKTKLRDLETDIKDDGTEVCEPEDGNSAMEFFFLRQDLFGDAAGIEIEGHTELSAQFNWVDGIKFDRPFPGDTFQLDDAHGSSYPDFFDTSIPVMSKRLLDALAAAGVSNIDAYPVVLRNRRDSAERSDYFAVNVIGRIDAVDLSQSPHEIRRGKPRFGGAMVIDGKRAGGLLAFRLPHSPRFIVVAESVARKLHPLALDSVLLQPTRSYSGDCFDLTIHLDPGGEIPEPGTRSEAAPADGSGRRARTTRWSSPRAKARSGFG